MKINEDMVMFIPACGLGERLETRGIKPYINIYEEKTAQAWMAINGVMSMAPGGMDIEVAVRQEMGCPPLIREATIHFMKPTAGQAVTIYNWLRRTRIRNYVLISNCDNLIDPESILEGIKLLDENKGRSGIVYTFHPLVKDDKRWSYVMRDSISSKIYQIKEKEAISDDAVAGVYLLNMFALRMAIAPEDRYLSEALARMQGLYAYRAKEYKGWNDLAQLDELEKGIPQSL